MDKEALKIHLKDIEEIKPKNWTDLAESVSSLKGDNGELNSQQPKIVYMDEKSADIDY